MARTAGSSSHSLLGMTSLMSDPRPPQRLLTAQPCRNLPRPTFFFQRRGDSQHLLFFPRPPYDLHADRQSFGRMGDGNYRRGIAEQVEEFRVAPGIEIVDRLAFDLPIALSVAECGYGRRRAQQDGILLHLREEARTEQIAPDPGIEQRAPGERGLSRRPLQKLLEDRTKIGVTFLEHVLLEHISLEHVSLEHGAQEHSASDHEELVPQSPRLFETFGLEALYLKSRAAQGFGCGSYGCTRFRRDRGTAIVFEITDLQIPGFFFTWPAHWHRGGAGVANIRTLHHLE